MIETLGLIAVGLVILVFGADWLVKGASRLALSAGISSLVVGLTIVAFGTSAPEMAVSVSAALSGSNEMAVANVVGSNIFNVLFILGVSALVAPLVVHRQLVRMDVPIMIGVSVLLLVLSLDGRLSLWDSLLLASLIVAYTVFLVAESRREKSAAAASAFAAEVNEAPGDGKGNVALDLFYIAVGLVALVLGSQWLVNGAQTLAKALGVSDVIIGLTIVAAGTSLPELATSTVAAFRGERDIAIGNVVGSNIFNICSVLGFSGLASGGALAVAPSMRAVDIPLMVGIALLCLPFFRTGHTVSRANGVVFLACYVAYVVWLIMAATQSPALPTLNIVLLGALLPALIVGVVVVTVLELRREARGE